MVTKTTGIFISLSFFIILADQMTKYLILKFQPQIAITPFLAITFIKNTGAGFGILTGYTTVLGILSLLVAAGIVYYYPKIPPTPLPQTAFALLLGGTVGNLIDRMFRGYVIDFIHFSFWPAFNVADMAITFSAAALLMYLWKNK